MDFATPLCEIAFKYGTDKCPQLGHAYTPHYFKLFNDKRNQIKKVLEFGIGSTETMPWAEGMRDQYVTGASLYMWREFFPAAEIYGVDYHASAMVSSERITSFQINTRNARSVQKLINLIGPDVDLVIDDGDHRQTAQIRLALAVLPVLSNKSTYIIEDSSDPDRLVTHLGDYDYEIISYPNKVTSEGYFVTKSNLIVLRHKPEK